MTAPFLLQAARERRWFDPSKLRGSGAVMAGRSEPADSLDFFPTPPWATRALFAEALPRLLFHGRGWEAEIHSAWDVCCGKGHMASPIAEYSDLTYASDIFDYGYGDVLDFLSPSARMHNTGVDWIIMNPPFNRAVDFALAALDLAQVGVAMLCRTAWAEGEDRYNRLFRFYRPSVAQFAERVPMVKARYAINAKSATAYAWFIFIRDQRVAPQPLWIPPCRKRLSRVSDILDFGGCSDLPRGHPVRIALDRRAA